MSETIIMGDPPLYYCGDRYGLLARLRYHPGQFPDSGGPSPIIFFLTGMLCENIYGQLGQLQYTAALQVPATTEAEVLNEETGWWQRIDAQKQIEMKIRTDLNAIRHTNGIKTLLQWAGPDNLIPGDYTDGLIEILDFNGPTKPTRIDWEHASIQVSAHAQTAETPQNIRFTLPLKNQDPIEIDFQDSNINADPMTVLELDDGTKLSITHETAGLDPDKQHYRMDHYGKDGRTIQEYHNASKDQFAQTVARYLDHI